MMQRGMKKEVSKQGQIISREKNLIWENSNGNLKKVVGRTQCFKIIEKIAFNIASEASKVYILSGQMLTKNAQNGPFWRFFENLKLAVKQCYQTSNF